MDNKNKLISNLANKILSPRINYSLRYLHHRGHYPNLNNPKDMSEILLSQMFAEDQTICRQYSQYIDKLGVREYVKGKGLENILLKNYGVWDAPEDVNFDDLPSKFVLKSNNGCAHHVICYDKSKLDIANAIATLKQAIDNGQNNVEPHYHYIKPKVYAEELVETPDGSWPTDYKFTCIGGKIVDIFVAVDRATSVKYCTLDLNWNALPYIRDSFKPSIIPPKPNHLDKLVEVAKILSKDFDFVRVDLYEYRDQPYISELTFFPWGGLMYGYKNEALELYGNEWLKLKQSKR